MANVLLLSETYLKENSVINTNVEFKQLRPSIMTAQDMQIQQAIGSPMFQELKSQVIGNTLTAANTTLIEDYIQPALMYWVLAEFPLLGSYKFANKGIVTQSSDNAQPAGMDNVNFLAKNYKAKAQWYTEQVTTFLCANLTDYPTYNSSVPDGGIHPRQNTFSAGLFVGRRPTQKRLTDGEGGIPTFKEPYDCDC